MKSRGKNEGCISLLIYAYLLVIIFGVLVALLFYGIIFAGAIFLIIYLFKFAIFVIKKIYFYIKQKRKERTELKNDNQIINENTSKKAPYNSHHKQMTPYQLERFAIECNAQLECKEQMAQYKEYYNIEDEDE